MRPNLITRGVRIDESTRDYVFHRLAFALNRTIRHVGAVTVRLKDDNGPKGGVDKLCQIMLVIPGQAAIVVNKRATEWRAAIDKAAHEAAGTLAAALKKRQRALRLALPDPLTSE